MKNWPLRNKILLLSIGLPIALIVVLFFMYYISHKQEVIDAYVEKARSICLGAEATRNQIEHVWQKGVFTIEQARAFADKGQEEQLMNMVPIVIAMNALKEEAKNSDYEMRVPKFKPRKKENTPDTIEADMLNHLKKNNKDEDFIIDKERNAIRYFRSIKLTQTCLYCHGDPSLSQEYWGNSNGKDPTGVTMENWKAGERHGAFEIIMSLDKADAHTRATMFKAGMLTLFGFALLAAISLFISQVILKPVKTSLETVEAIASGDFTRENSINQTDEIGRLSAAIERMRQRMRAIFEDLRVNASNLSNASNQLNATSNELASMAEQTSSQSATVANAGEILSASTEELAANAEEIKDSANSVAAGIEEMSASIHEVARNCSKELEIASQANQMSQSNQVLMTELGEAAKEVDHVVDLINNIASQTNLLALNATIEAASAGEAGKGFAVVANEVKELARQTAEATENISNQIREIQSKTGQTIDANAEIARIIEEISIISNTIAAAIEEQSATSSEISHTMQRVSTATQDIASNIRESSDAARNVSQNILSISEASQHSGACATETNASAEELSKMAEQLNSIVRQFKI